MAGRYGNDKLNQFMMAVFLGCAVLNLFVRNAYVSTVLNSWECLLILLVYIRMFSRNISKRYAENQKFIRGRITLIGCPKLDEGDYTEKLTAIIKANDIRSVTIVRMEVPCCGGLEMAAKNAIKASGKFLPWHVAVVSAEGQILSE